jgi:hypothetical protein
MFHQYHFLLISCHFESKHFLKAMIIFSTFYCSKTLYLYCFLYLLNLLNLQNRKLNPFIYIIQSNKL